MATRYDAVVVGAGLGGLSAAAQLATRGHSVLLLERHNVPGGYATSFVRGRFEFEVALHELSGIGRPGKPGTLLKYLEKIGVAERVEFVRIDDFYRSVFPGFSLTVPVGIERATTTLCEAFPHEADGIRRFLDRVFGMGRELDHVNRVFGRGVPAPGNLATLPWKARKLLRYGTCTWGQVLDRDVGDPLARAVLSQAWGYLGLPPSQVGFAHLAAVLHAYVAGQPAYVVGRSQALSSAFVDAIEERGGEVRLGCGVSSITVRDGRVSWVVTERGEEIAADAVISNADPVTTCRDLVGARHLSRRFWKGLRPSEPGPSSFNVYLGAARSADELGVTDHETFINADADPDAHWAQMGTLGAPAVLVMSCYNVCSADVSPPGTSMFGLTTLQYGDQWHDVAPADYLDTKHRIADAMIEMAESVVPGLRSAAEVVAASTPVTNMRFVGHQGGAVYGFDNHPWDAHVFRMSNRAPLGGLYFAGAWAMPGGGFEPSMMSGRMAAEMVHAATRTSLRKGA